MSPEEQIAFMEQKIKILQAVIEATTEHDNTSKNCMFCTVSEALQSLTYLDKMEEGDWKSQYEYWTVIEKFFVKKGINLDHVAKKDSNYKRKWRRGKK
jgi:hypothetical protein